MAEQSEKSGSVRTGDLYLLAIGVLAGILLGPFVLGSYWPDTYEKLFPSIDNAISSLSEYDQETAIIQYRMESTDVSPQAIEEMVASRQEARTALKMQVVRAQRAIGRQHSVGLALAFVCLVSLASRYRPTVQTAQAGLASMWIALALAHPGVYRYMSPAFAILLCVVVLAVATAWNWKRSSNDESTDKQSETADAAE